MPGLCEQRLSRIAMDVVQLAPTLDSKVFFG